MARRMRFAAQRASRGRVTEPAAQSPTRPEHALIALQRTVGNQHVVREMERAFGRPFAGVRLHVGD